MNAWHDLTTGESAPAIVTAMIEIPKGSRHKYELDKASGVIRLDRVLHSSVHYPADYGLIPRTLYGDGDPLDVLVVTHLPTFPGCIVDARVVGLFRMLDNGEPDDKVVAVSHRDPTFDNIQQLADLSPHLLREIEHFFRVYKELEDKRVEPLGWADVEEAKACIRSSATQYAEAFPPSSRRAQ